MKLLAPLAVFGAVLVAMVALPGSPTSPPALSAGADLGSPSGDALRDARAAVRAAPGSVDAYALLGDAYVTRARATGDPSLYARADRVLGTALRRDPRNVAALVGAGTLAGLRHDFRGQLRLGLAAKQVAPALARPYTVIADAQIELGRYSDAARSIQELVDLKPGLPAYARVSYYRELTGDQAGAVRAMRFAASAGGTPESLAYVQALTGNLELARGRSGAAREAYRASLRTLPGYSDALEGLARVDAARGDLRGSAPSRRTARPHARSRSSLSSSWPLDILGPRDATSRPRAPSSRATGLEADSPTPRPCFSRRTMEAPPGRCGSATACGEQSPASALPTHWAGRSRERAGRARVSFGHDARSGPARPIP
jgi:hypothetical protein